MSYPRSKKPVAPRRPSSTPVYQYLCDCHGVAASYSSSATSDPKTKKQYGTLGTWRCASDGKKCKVKRRKAEVAA